LRLLLDTHIWIWSQLDPDRLSARVSAALQAEDSEIWLSSISLWELSILVEKGRVELDEHVDAWMARALEAAPMREAPVSHSVVRGLQLIETPHRDPADRFIAATAAVLDLHLVTTDSQLRRGTGFRIFPE